MEAQEIFLGFAAIPNPMSSGRGIGPLQSSLQKEDVVFIVLDK
jgi:hypothetical protein